MIVICSYVYLYIQSTHRTFRTLTKMSEERQMNAEQRVSFDAQLEAALRAIEALAEVRGPLTRLRVETLDPASA